MDTLNILVLHRLGNPKLVPIFLRQHVFLLKTNFPDHNYVYHDTALPLPGYVRDFEFDAIILDVTLLCIRWLPPADFAAVKEEYSFVARSNAVKIAIPQDEYDCNELLDEWMCEWRVDRVFSVISSHWDVLYPGYHKVGSIELGYTGYVDETLISRKPKPFASRTIDIGYRAGKLLPYFGRIGQTKWTIGRDVDAHGKNSGVKTDIVIGPRGTLYGEAWLSFINDSKLTLGANSGSSLLDPRGDIQRNVRAWLKQRPHASFEEVEEQCFKGLDLQYSFTAISPRVLEAALLSSCQILVDGEYSGIVKPWEHYIPIRPDASNFSEVFDAMRDLPLVERLARNCREAILDTEALRDRNKAKRMLDAIASFKTSKRVTSDPDKGNRVAALYGKEMGKSYQDYWNRQAFRRGLVNLVDRFPLAGRLARSVRSAIRRRSV